jgi:hypothetical protein
MIDKIIESFSSEREGNDAWLRYKLVLGYDWDDLCLSLSENHNGWNGKVKENRSFILSEYEGEKLIEKIKEYVSDFAEDEEEESEVLQRLEYILNEQFSMNIKLIDL